jgi:hypothetical protein
VEMKGGKRRWEMKAGVLVGKMRFECEKGKN